MNTGSTEGNAGEMPCGVQLLGKDACLAPEYSVPKTAFEPGVPIGSSGLGAAYAKLKRWRPEVSATSANLLVSIFLVCSANIGFWQEFSRRLGLDSVSHWVFFCLTGVAICIVFNIFFSLVSWKPVHKLVIIFVLCLSAICGYFMQSYGIVIDSSMIVNVLETDAREASEQFSWALGLHFAALGVLPSVILSVTRIRYRPWKGELALRSRIIAVSSLVLAAMIFAGYKQISLFGRENMSLRMYVNPTYPVYSAIKAVKKRYGTKRNEPLRVIAPDAVKPAHPKTAIVLVVGETARAQEFSLNGYSRDTNPELASREVLSFTDVQSCGTNTAESVPCMFSHLQRTEYSRTKAATYENLLDVLKRAGVQVVWRDNNSGSKGVADRVAYEDVSKAKDAELCSSGECYDDILLKDLNRILDEARGDLLVVLHQKGSHGPSYYRRTPKSFERFLPLCTRDNLQDCDRQSIVNAYDNTILYTDHVLSQVIDLLKAQKYSTAMLYVSDHGESLGESDIYLHGLPYAIAPDQQKHVPMIFWGSPAFFRQEGIDAAALKAGVNSPFSHDYLFHSLLGLFHVKTKDYRPDLDIFNGVRRG